MHRTAHQKRGKCGLSRTPNPDTKSSPSVTMNFNESAVIGFRVSAQKSKNLR